MIVPCNSVLMKPAPIDACGVYDRQAVFVG